MKRVLVKDAETLQVIDSADITESEVEFFVSHRAQYICEVIDVSAEYDGKKQKADKKKSFEFKGKTIAELRTELNEYLELMKE